MVAYLAFIDCLFAVGEGCDPCQLFGGGYQIGVFGRACASGKMSIVIVGFRLLHCFYGRRGVI